MLGNCLTDQGVLNEARNHLSNHHNLKHDRHWRNAGMEGLMNTKMLVKARELFSVDYMPKEINRANQRKWVRSIRRLGDKWLLAQTLKFNRGNHGI